MNNHDKALKKVIKVITDTMKKTNTTVSMLAKRTEKESHNIYRILKQKAKYHNTNIVKDFKCNGKSF